MAKEETKKEAKETHVPKNITFELLRTQDKKGIVNNVRIKTHEGFTNDLEMMGFVSKFLNPQILMELASRVSPDDKKFIDNKK